MYNDDLLLDYYEEQRIRRQELKERSDELYEQ